MHIERRLADLGLDLPPAMSAPVGTEIPFAWVRVIGPRAFVSGHGAVDPDGAPGGPFGKVPSGLSLEQAQTSAQRATLAVLASLQEALGDLDRVSAWAAVNGFVNADPGYARTTLVMNPCSQLLIDLYGREAGTHARTAIGVAALPFDLPVVISAEVALHP
jgi:enamine deaminase RidA (YjgF/YER057c/UK114 family)